MTLLSFLGASAGIWGERARLQAEVPIVRAGTAVVDAIAPLCAEGWVYAGRSEGRSGAHAFVSLMRAAPEFGLIFGRIGGT